ncbi:MAG TPA: SRPBCC family protein [Opitutus sp.]|nr:SRPBCC family protein [Opitutus sp.]
MSAAPPPLTALDRNRDLTISRIIDAPRDRVFRIWIEHLPAWWGPHGMSTPLCEMDLRPGGAFRTVMRAPDGTEYPTSGVFLEIVENERIVFTDAYEAGWGLSPQPFMTAIATFEDFHGKTRLTACVRHWSSADREKHEQMGFRQGWGESLDRLAAVAARL